MENKYLLDIKNKLDKKEWYRLVFLGDSITSTEWVYPNWRGMIEYVLKDKLEQMMGQWELPDWLIRCYNAGYNGATTREMSEFVETDVLIHRPDLVIFMHTDNDKYINMTLDQHRQNLDGIFQKLLGAAVQVVFATSVAGTNEEVNAEYLAYIKASQEVIDKYMDKIQVVDLFSEYRQLDRERLFTFISENGNAVAGIEPGGLDYAHPNQLGNAYMAKILLKDIFDIEFDPELYIKDTLAGKKYPSY